MPLHTNKKILFIHIPKCGGTSIEIALGMQKKALFYLAKNIYNFGGISAAPQHLRLRDLYTISEIGDIKDDLFIFTFVRNPYDRFISEYFHVNKGKEFNKTHFKKWYKGYFSLINSDHKIPQSDFLLIDGELKVDFIGRFENFNEDWVKLMKLIEMGNIELPITNISTKRTKKGYDSYLDIDDILFINNLYKDDFTNFGYDMITKI